MSKKDVKGKQVKGNGRAGKRRSHDKLLRKSNVGIYKVTPGDKGQFVDVNPAFVKILGYGSKKELMNLHVCDIYADPSHRKGFSRKMTDNGFVKNEELHLKKKDGTPITAIDTGIAVHDKDGQVLYFEGILEDVTERKRIEEALQASEELYRKLIETSPDAITMTDLNGNIVMANKQALEVHGCKNENELLGKNSFEMIAPRDRERALANTRKVLEKGEIRNIGYTLIRNDGSFFDADLSASLIKDAEGNPKAFIGIIRDVTERRKEEKERRQKADDLSLVNLLNTAVIRGNSLSDIINIMTGETIKMFPVFGTTVYLLDESGKNLIMQNMAVPADLAKKIEKVIGIKIPEVTIPLTEDNEYTKILKEGKTVVTSDEKKITKFIADHTENPLLKKIAPAIQSILKMKNVISVPIVSEGIAFGVLEIASKESFSVSDIKRLEFLATHFLTIVKRKVLDDALKGSEEQYRKLIETSPDSITLNDMNGKITMVNQAAVTMRGYDSEEELLGKNIMELLAPHEIEKAKNGMEETLRKGHVNNVEYALMRKDGTSFSAEVSVSILKDSKGKPNAFMAIVRDISERKHVEKALKESEEQYRKLIETSPDPILVSDLDGNIVMANPQALEVYGCSRKEELIGKNAFNIIALHDRKRAMKNYKSILESGSMKNVEYTLLKNNRTTFIAELSTSLIKDSEGKPRFFIAVVRDITDRKRIENALRESEELYRTLIETSPYAITINDMSGRIFLVNRRSVEMHGATSKKDLIGKNAFDFIEPAAKEKLMSNMKTIIEEGGEELTEYSLKNLAGDYFPAEVTCTIIKDNQGKPQAMMAMGQDITGRKRMERELAAEKERLAVTLQSIAESVISVDTDGNIIFMNEVAEQLTGWRQEDAVGKSLCGILNIVGSNNDQVDCDLIIRRVIETGRATDAIDDAILVAKNETERIIAQSCAPIRDSDENIVGVVLVIRDITEKEKLEKEVFKARKLESIGLLAGGIAHDFNNILTGITSNLFMAKMELGKDNPVYNIITDAEKAAFRANKLTNQLLTFAKGGAPIKESQSIREIIEEAVGFSLSGSNIDCELKLQDNLWTLEIDRGQIDQVITNLIINAEQAMPDGGTITVTAENVTIRNDISEDTTAYLALAPGKYIKIIVKDEGVGIRPEDLDKIYDPYYSTKDSGSGLGLTICYSIVRKHNGLILAKSRLGVGTTMNVYLPASGKKAKPVKEEKKEPDLRGVGKVLLMDDEEVVRITAGQILKSIGYIVEYAKDGSEALKKYEEAMKKAQPFDTVVMDLTVPGGMGGRETVKKLLAIDPDAKAIVSSGYSTDPIMSDYRKHGFCGVVSKPYTVEEFNSVIKKAIAERRR